MKVFAIYDIDLRGFWRFFKLLSGVEFLTTELKLARQWDKSRLVGDYVIPADYAPFQSAGGPAHSKTLARG